jgi:hypothetical protein
MHNSGNRHLQHNIGFSLHLTQRKGGCTWNSCRHRCLNPKAISDYKRSTFEFDVKEVHPTDQMDMHRQTGEMIFSTLANTSMTAAKLQVSLKQCPVSAQAGKNILPG